MDLFEILLPPATDPITVDLLRREIWIVGAVLEGSSQTVVRGLREMYRLHPEAPISVFVNCEGGDPNEALVMADFMLAFSKKLTVKTSVVGTSYSAATLISAAGTKGHRYAIPSAEFLIHALSIGHIGGKIEDVEETTRHLIRLNGKLASHLSSITGMEMSRVEAMMSKETFLNAQEAIQCGLCDQIGMI